MNEHEFGEAVQRVFDATLKARKTKVQAHKAAETFRSNLIKALAQTASTKERDEGQTPRSRGALPGVWER